MKVKPRNPKLNRRHPLAKGLQLAFPFTERGQGGVYHDLVNGYTGIWTWETSQAANGSTTTLLGTGLDFQGLADTNTNGIIVDSRFALGTGHLASYGITVEMWFRPGTFSGNGMLAENGDQWNNNTFYFNRESDGPTFRINSTTGTAVTDGVTALTVGQIYHIVGTWASNDRDGTGSPIVYLDGELFDTRSGPIGGVLDTGNSALCIGARPDNTSLPESESVNGSIISFRIWNRQLRTGEIKQLYVDPWGMYA